MLARFAIGVLFASVGIVGAACVGSDSDIPPAVAVAGDGGAAFFDAFAPPTFTDAPPGVPVACNRTSPFGPAQKLGPTVNAAGGRQYAGRLSPDGTTLYFMRDVPGASRGFEIFRAERMGTSFEFGPASAVEGVNGDGADTTPTVGPGGRLIWGVERVAPPPAVAGNFDIWWADPATPGFAAARLLAEVSTTDKERHPYALADGHALYFSRSAQGTTVIMMSPWAGQKFGLATPVPGLTGTATLEIGDPIVTSDELVAYYKLEDPATARADMFRTSRRATVDAFRTGEPMTDLNTPANEAPTWISDDDCALLFSRSADGSASADLYVAQRPL
jgi:hypothetical protein